ncbi:MAG: methyl-accepting chemotaxis protein [Shewanella sp.]
MKDIASGDGDLRVRLDYSKDDELKELVTYFNQFVAKLHDNISNVVTNTHVLSSISTNLTQENRNAKAVSEQQLMAMDEVASAVLQMTHVAADISHNAHDTARAVSDAMALSQTGAASVLETQHSLELLVTDVNKTAEVVAELNESTKNAESILLAINSIAEQTNLLALNAAIEAARAGEQGRGFAVVADEVRTLASRTQTSTKEIQAVLESLQTKADIAMSIIRNSLNNAELCNQKSLEAETTIKQVAVNMADIDQRNELIAAATEEQGQTTKEMESHVLNIQNMSHQTANSLTRLDEMARSIETVKVQLIRVTEQFKTS